MQLSTIISYIIQNFTLKLETPEFPKTNYRVSRMRLAIVLG